jgi:hypothetical protein
MNASALQAAYMDLRARSAAADATGDWREAWLLEALCGVAAYVKRLGDRPKSVHCRADKAGDLLVDAIQVLRLVFLAYTGWPHDTPRRRRSAPPPKRWSTPARPSSGPCGPWRALVASACSLPTSTGSATRPGRSPAGPTTSPPPRCQTPNRRSGDDPPAPPRRPPRLSHGGCGGRPVVRTRPGRMGPRPGAGDKQRNTQETEDQ